MSRWLVTGAGGMLGQDLVTALEQRGEQVTGVDRAALDVTEPGAVDDMVSAARPDVVVNCAAWTAVDAAEDHEEGALAVNAGGASHLADACADAGARLIQLSTDYVFDGTGQRPYAEDDRPARSRPMGGPSWRASRPCLTGCRTPVSCCERRGCTGRTEAVSSER